ncbi:hypothetical protein [Emticicia sp. BO119]|uniref:hypothetical protein n=1 Tax=Emticicia sp. BO119 TaxID=2757768 RepID=UPI0015F052EB|nr:hypothetical protein [Emticicia sp. BO119]MBA4852155.1 hypothetical protein [Emticicia sp. BO119]
MEHKSDDFFRRKIENIEDSLPENSTFDEQLFWGALQKNLDKSHRKSWWQWVAAAACIVGLILWGISTFRAKPVIPVTINRKEITPDKKEVNPVPVVIAEKPKMKMYKSKRKVEVQPTKELKIEVEQLAVKVNIIPMQVPVIKQDSIQFKSVMAETKPQFRTIHVNQISNTEKSPVPQPKFKIRFAARNQH